MDHLVELAKTIMPWLTGGAVGALITYFLNSRKGLREKVRLRIEQRFRPISLPESHFEGRQLSVTYKGTCYTSLQYCEIVVTNVGTKDVSRTPFLVAIGEATKLLEQDFALCPSGLPTRELALTTPQVTIPLRPNEWQLDFGPLQPGDSARAALLMHSDNQEEQPPTVEWRGAADTTLDRAGVIGGRDLDMHNAIVIAAAFFLAGGVPLVGGAVQGFVILLGGRALVRFFLGIASRLRETARPTYEIGAIHQDVGQESRAVVSIGGRAA